MPSQIRATRLEVNDRFPMLGFTIRTDAAPRMAEIAIGSDLHAFTAKEARTTQNFWSSHGQGPLSVNRGEAVYVVPPEVLARFIGQDKLYFAVATWGENGQTKPEIANLPTEGSPYINLKGFTGRSLRRLPILPTRRVGATYGPGNGHDLEWAGDTARPGMTPVTSGGSPPKAAAPTGRQTPAGAVTAPASGGNGHAGTAASEGNGHAKAAALEYDDGYGQLPPSPSPVMPPAPRYARRVRPGHGIAGATELADDGARALDVGANVVEAKLRVFIPAPVVTMDLPPVGVVKAFGGDGRGFSYDTGTHRGQIIARVQIAETGIPQQISGIDRNWGESTEYNTDDVVDVPGKPSWFKALKQGAAPIRRKTLELTDSNLRARMGSNSLTENLASIALRSTLTQYDVAGALPLITPSPDIDAELYLHLWIDDGRIKAALHGSHDGFPAYEFYVAGTRIYSYDPVAAGASPTALLGTSSVTVNTSSIDVGPAVGAAATAPVTAPVDVVPVGTGEALAYGPVHARDVPGSTRHVARAWAMSGEAFSLNWDDVEVIRQPTDMSCWAAAAAMVIGWRDRVSITPQAMAEIWGRVQDLQTGLAPEVVQKFAAALDLKFEPPQSYTIEGFRNLLETRGPLWVGAAVPTLHAIVVTGLYSDAGNIYVRIADPWDRVVGTPGSPGNYLDTHNSGSRYILVWDDFVAEYERAATDFTRVNIQILHSAGTDGRQPNTGKPAEYAMALKTAGEQAPGASGARRRKPKLAPVPQAHGFADPLSLSPEVTVERVTGADGSVSWDFDQVRGLKQPAGATPAIVRTPPRDAKTLQLEGWPYVEPPEGGRVAAGFKVDWQYDGAAVGNVRIAPTGNSQANGWTLTVTARADLDPPAHPPSDPAAPACIAIIVRWTFHGPDSEAVARLHLRLLGDGHVDQQVCWEHEAQ